MQNMQTVLIVDKKPNSILNSAADKEYLKDQQYAGMVNYQHRKNFDEGYGSNEISFQQWQANQYTGNYHLSNFDEILEVGCGDGTFWRYTVGENQFYPNITITDLSTKMLDTCKYNLSSFNMQTSYQVADIDSLPFDNEKFNAICAHLVMYHAENPEQAIAGIYAALKLNGLFGMSVLNQGVNQAIWQLAHLIDPQIPDRSFTARFTNFDADTILPKFFKNIEKRNYVNTLKFPVSEPIINMVKSSPVLPPKISDNFFTLFQNKIDVEIKSKGYFENEFNGSLYLCKKK